MTATTLLDGLPPGEFIVLRGTVNDEELRLLCGGSPAVRRRAVRAFKAVGATYTPWDGFHLGFWRYGLPDLHWHPAGARLGPDLLTPGEFYRRLLASADAPTLGRSLMHELALFVAGRPSWLELALDEVSRRAAG